MRAGAKIDCDEWLNQLARDQRRIVFLETSTMPSDEGREPKGGRWAMVAILAIGIGCIWGLWVMGSGLFSILSGGM